MNATAIRQQIIESLANLSGEQLLQIRELIEQIFCLKLNLNQKKKDNS